MPNIMLTIADTTYDAWDDGRNWHCRCRRYNPDSRGYFFSVGMIDNRGYRNRDALVCAKCGDMDLLGGDIGVAMRDRIIQYLVGNGLTVVDLYEKIIGATAPWK